GRTTTRGLSAGTSPAWRGSDRRSDLVLREVSARARLRAARAVNARRFRELVDPGAELERVATGFTFTEGPVWNAEAALLVFSDVVGDVRWQWSERDGARELRRPNNHGNGMVYD